MTLTRDYEDAHLTIVSTSKSIFEDECEQPPTMCGRMSRGQTEVGKRKEHRDHANAVKSLRMGETEVATAALSQYVQRRRSHNIVQDNGICYKNTWHTSVASVSQGQ